MTGTIFDLVESPPATGKEGFFEIAEKAPKPKDNSFLNQVSDYAKTFLKGSVEGISKLGTLMGPSGENIYQPEQEQRKLTQFLEEKLPTEEGSTQKAIRRGLNIAPSAIATPGAPIQAGVRSLISGFSGQGAKELGLPEWAQSAAEITAFLTPDVTKKLLATGKNKDLIEGAKKLGLTDEQITPLIQSEFKQKWLSKLSPKRGSTQKALENSKNALSQAYTKIQESPEALKGLSLREQTKFIKSLSDKFSKMPYEVRNKLKKDAIDLLKKPMTGESLINFYSDVNYNLGPQTKQLSLLKGPIKEAVNSISPNLAKDFNLINELYTKYYPISAKLKPNLTDDIVKAGETLGIIGSITMGHYPSLIGIAGEKAARKIAQQMLINPHLQQLSKKMVVALNQNKYFLSKKVVEDYINEIRKIDKSSADKFEELSKEELKELFNHQDIENRE